MYLTRRFPDASEYAVHGLFYAFAGFIFVLYTLRMETAFFRFGNQPETKDRAFSTASVVLFCSAIGLSAIILLFAEDIAGLIKSKADTRYLVWLVLIMGFDTLVALPFAKMRLDDRPLKFAIFKALNTVLGIFFALIFLEILPWMDRIGMVEVGSFLDRPYYIDWVFIANIIASGLMVLLLAKEYFKVKFQFDPELLKKMWTYAWPLIIVGLAGVFNQLSDRVFLNNLSSATDSGIYNGAIKIAVIMSLFVSAFNYAAEPFFFNQMHNQDAKIIYAKVAQAFTLAASILFLGILLYVDIIEHLIGKNYREGIIILPALQFFHLV
jgi:O-antigen/teichoic acid export membrane protein